LGGSLLLKSGLFKEVHEATTDIITEIKQDTSKETLLEDRKGGG